jgi:hypothetical protein
MEDTHMRKAMIFLAVLGLVGLLCAAAPHATYGQELTKEQAGVWAALEEQVGLDVKQDWEGMKKFMHPKGCFWSDTSPTPSSMTSYSYYAKLRSGEDEIVANRLVPVSVVVVDDVAIINFYGYNVVKTKDGRTVEKILRGHNTWKKENGRWLLLSTYNTEVKMGGND